MRKLIITEIPLKNLYYFQYLIYGLNKQGKNMGINFKIRPNSLSDRFFLRFYLLYRILKKYWKYFNKKQIDSNIMKGYYQENKNKVHFCYDVADSPFTYDMQTLKTVDIYFKAQCPMEFKKTGFEVTPELVIPYPSNLFTYLHKIYPSMLAPGFGVNNIYSLSQLDKGYEEMFVSGIKKDKSLMCYFGDSGGSKEDYILKLFKDKVAHPNIKRGIASKLIPEIIPDSDARVLHDGDYDASFQHRRSNLFISMKEFPSHISKFKYNLNISGNFLSIPWRFIHSFTVGTAIITDKLKLKWYLPFDSEVYETVEMGYLPIEQVNWEGFKNDLIKLPNVDPNQILSEFQKKWSPEAFAAYILNTCKNKIKEL